MISQRSVPILVGKGGGGVANPLFGIIIRQIKNKCTERGTDASLMPLDPPLQTANYFANSTDYPI